MDRLIQVIRLKILQLKKWSLALTIMLGTAVSAVAQNAGDHYLYPAFGNAVVVFKNGHKEAINLNYNTVTEEMVFVRNNQYMALDNIETMDTICLNDDVFIPYEGFFLRLFTTDPEHLLIRHRHKLLNTGKSTGYGTSQTHAIDNYSTIIASGKIYELNISGNYELIAENSNYIRTDRGIYMADNVSELSKLYSVPKKRIRNYIKDNNLNPEDVEDFKELIIFLKKERY